MGDRNISQRQSWLLVALAAILLAAQGLVAVHAAKFGDKPHDHHGQPCVISLAGEHNDKAIANGTAAIVAVFLVFAASHTPFRQFFTGQTALPACARAPPSH